MNDLISRQVAIDGVKRLSLGETDATRLAMRIGDYLERLSSAQPERKRGRWSDFSMSAYGVPKEACGVCGEWSFGMGENYCPECGADMRGEQDDER